MSFRGHYVSGAFYLGGVMTGYTLSLLRTVHLVRKLYFSNTDTSIIWTLFLVPLVSVLKRFYHIVLIHF